MNKFILIGIKILSIILVISICIFLISEILDAIPDEGTFDDLIFEEFKDDIKFDSIKISQRYFSSEKGYEDISKRDTDLDKISELTSYLRQLKIKELLQAPSAEGNLYYDIYLVDRSLERKSISIKIFSNFIEVNKRFEIEDRVKKIHKEYKILNDKNFMDFINNYFRSISKDKKTKG